MIGLSGYWGWSECLTNGSGSDRVCRQNCMVTPVIYVGGYYRDRKQCIVGYRQVLHDKMRH